MAKTNKFRSKGTNISILKSWIREKYWKSKVRLSNLLLFSHSVHSQGFWTLSPGILFRSFQYLVGLITLFGSYNVGFNDFFTLFIQPVLRRASKKLTLKWDKSHVPSQGPPCNKKSTFFGALVLVKVPMK